MLFLFESCEFHPATRRLLVNGVDHVLGGRAFDLLQTLIENHDRVVSKDELYERVWPGLAVEPGNLQVQIWALRKVLGHQVIATVARRGYRFMPAVVRVSVGTSRLAEANPALLASATPPPATTDALLDKLVRGMADHRLVTLIAPEAGTSDPLVQAAAQLMAPLLAGRVWQIEAEALTGHHAEHLHTAAGQPLRQTSPRLHALLSRIARRPAVLVVLNGHRAVGLPEAVTQLLAGSSGLRLLVSSRQGLALPGEKVLTASGNAAEFKEVRAPQPGRRSTDLRWHSR